MKNLAALFILFVILSGCDKGIEPDSGINVSGFGGTITFEGEWPEGISRTHLVVFKDNLVSSGDFTALNLRYLSTEIPYGIKTFTFSSLDSSYVPITSGEFNYVAVVQSKSEQVSLNRADWFVAGIYYSGADTTKPGSLVIPENQFVTGINIKCDFNNPPPQPPGGRSHE